MFFNSKKEKKEEEMMKDAKRFMEFVSPYKGWLLLTIFLGVLKFSFPIATPLIMQYAIDDILFNESFQDKEKIHTLVILMSIVLLIYVLMRPFVEYFRQYLAHDVSNRILRDVRKKVYQHLQTLSLSFFHNRKSGEVISRIITDVEQTKNFIMTGLMNIWLDVITVVIVIGIMLYLNVTLTIVSLIVFPMYMISVKYFYKRFKDATKKRSQALANLQSYLHEKIQGIGVIMSFAREKEEMTKFEEENDTFFERSVIHAKRNAQTFAATNTIADIGPLLVILIAGIYVVQYNLTIGTLVAFTGLLSNLYTPFKRLADSSNILTQSIASIERIYELLDEKAEIINLSHAKDKNIEHGSIMFQNVSFGYGKSQQVLREINLSIASGKTVAFVGESGGGKSSLINLLPRFYDVTSGDILIDEISIKDYTLHSLRSQIGIVSQENILFNESVYENIKLGNPSATKEEIVEACKQAEAHDFILALPAGYDTHIGERGVKLSGGQKQRLALARAFLKNPSILILDEATSALDLESEHHIQQTLQKLSQNKTTLIVAHRLSTIVHADQIVYVEHGEIKEMGTHEELMTRKGAYYNLFTIQTLH